MGNNNKLFEKRSTVSQGEKKGAPCADSSNQGKEKGCKKLENQLRKIRRMYEKQSFLKQEKIREILDALLKVFNEDDCEWQKILEQLENIIGENHKREIWDNTRICMNQYNRYIELEPQKNQTYRHTFRSEMGIISYMERYVQEIEQELAVADEIKWMQQIAWGNYLQFLHFALIKHQNEKNKIEEEKKITEESQYLKYIDISEDELKENPTWFEEIQNKNNCMLMAEKRKKDKRKVYEKLEKDLNGLELFFCLGNTEGWPAVDNGSDIDRVNYYEEKALELKAIFEKMLKELNIQIDEINRKDYSEWIEQIDFTLG